MKANALLLLATSAVVSFSVNAKDTHSSHHGQAKDLANNAQKYGIEKSIQDAGFGPQSPRNIDSATGSNGIRFSAAPPRGDMNLCNLHFHQNAEHSGGEFAKYAGAGDGHGYHTGYLYSGALSKAEMAPLGHEICPGEHGSLHAGDTIETHYVFSSAQVKPGPTLGACLSDSIKNPQLRVEAQVYVLVNDTNALDFRKLAAHDLKNGYFQALNIPDNSGTPVQYAGSTTGPSYNEAGSPLQVTWSVRPKVAKVDISTVGEWCKENVFKEDHAHGARNLVVHPGLLSTIER